MGARSRAGRSLARRLAVTMATVLAMTGLVAVAADADAHHVQEPTGVVASGLNNPRHLSVARNGRVWVSEAGAGGRRWSTSRSGPAAVPSASGPRDRSR